MSTDTKTFDLTDVEGRKAYFEHKVGPELEKLRVFLKDHTFIAYLLGKKSSGKGTYSKMLREVLGGEMIEHISVGDMIRDLDSVMSSPEESKELREFLDKNYRGHISLEEALDAFHGRGTTKLLPSEFILALVKHKIAKLGKTTLFIDGFPRDLDQMSYTFFFRDLIDYREDPDTFILIKVPTVVIDERVKYRRICPECQTSRNLKLLATKKVVHEDGEFHLICDNPECDGARMVTKEGDEFGIEPIKQRLLTDATLIDKAETLHGIPKVVLKNSVPVDGSEGTYEEYEITPEFHYELDEASGEVITKTRPWQVLDDNGVPCYSLMPPPVVASMIKQLTEVFNL